MNLLTPAQQVIWSMVAAGAYGKLRAKTQYIEQRWAVLPRGGHIGEPRALHICRPRKIYWAVLGDYKKHSFQHKARVKGPFEIEVTKRPWGTGGVPSQLELTLNGFRGAGHDDICWHFDWDCNLLSPGADRCYPCHVDVPSTALGLQRFMLLGEKV